MSKTLAALEQNIFTPADAGLFTLPEQVNQVRAALARLTIGTTDQPPGPDATMELLVHQAKEAAKAGTDLPDPVSVLTAHQNQKVHQYRQQMIARATEETESEVYRSVMDSADEIIREHLRPVHDSTVASLRASLEISGSYADDPRSALTAPVKIRTALAEQPTLHDRLEIVNAARTVLFRQPDYEPQYEPDSLHSWIRNAEEVWPRVDRRTRRPWPDGLAGTTWLLRHGAVLWMPTAAEHDAAWWAQYGEETERLRANRTHLNAYRARLTNH